MSQRALQEATEVIQNELLAFSYVMLKRGYDVEGIMEFLSVCDDEDIDFILEDADILTEDVVDEMSDEDVNYYGEQLEIIAERFGGLGAAALRRMPPSMLRRLAASNPNIAKMIRKLGLLDDAAKQTTKVRPTPGTITRPRSGSSSGTKGSSSGTKGSSSGTKGSGSGTTGPDGRPKLGTKGKIATGAAVGTGILASVFSPQIKNAITGLTGGDSGSGDTPGGNTPDTDMEGNPTGCKGPGGCADGRGQDPALGKTPPTSKEKDPTPKRPETGKTPWWLGPQGNQTKLGRRPRYDVALQSYRNPSQSLRNGFEMVADYLISEGHVDTIEEARYVINQMEVDDITEILNEVLQ